MAIIALEDLPASIRSDELVLTMLEGANAKAARVAPCLTAPSASVWAASTDYVIGDQAQRSTGEFLEVTVAGTSGTVEPTAPLAVGATVTDGTVTWKRIAPTTSQVAEAKLVLIGAIKRWSEAGSGAMQTQIVGPFQQTVDTRQRSSGYNLWPSEIKQLQDICASGLDASSGAFSLSPARCGSEHLPWCSLAFGATYCSCGADIAGFPLYESDVECP